MSFVVQGYNNTSAPNKMVKNLTANGTFTGVLKGPCDILNPVIMIDSATYPENLNYAYIEQFKRYYFVTDIICEINGLYTLQMQVDPLTTYRQSISGKTAVIARQENSFDLYIPDADFKVEQRTRTQRIEFPNSFPRNPIYVLTTV